MDTQALLEKASHLAAEGQLTTAQEILSQALDQEPEALVHFNLGILFKQDGQPLKALEHFEAASALEPDQAEIWNEIGLVYDEMGKSRMAEGFYKKALELDPTLAQAWNNWGVCAFLAGQYAAAQERFSKAVEWDPESESAWFNLRDTLETLGLTEEAQAADAKLKALENR